MQMGLNADSSDQLLFPPTPSLPLPQEFHTFHPTGSPASNDLARLALAPTSHTSTPPTASTLPPSINMNNTKNPHTTHGNGQTLPGNGNENGRMAMNTTEEPPSAKESDPYHEYTPNLHLPAATPASPTSSLIQEACTRTASMSPPLAMSPVAGTSYSATNKKMAERNLGTSNTSASRGHLETSSANHAIPTSTAPTPTGAPALGSVPSSQPPNAAQLNVGDDNPSHFAMASPPKSHLTANSSLDPHPYAPKSPSPFQMPPEKERNFPSRELLTNKPRSKSDATSSSSPERAPSPRRFVSPPASTSVTQANTASEATAAPLLSPNLKHPVFPKIPESHADQQAPHPKHKSSVDYSAATHPTSHQHHAQHQQHHHHHHHYGHGDAHPGASHPSHGHNLAQASTHSVPHASSTASSPPIQSKANSLFNHPSLANSANPRGNTPPMTTSTSNVSFNSSALSSAISNAPSTQAPTSHSTAPSPATNAQLTSLPASAPSTSSSNSLRNHLASKRASFSSANLPTNPNNFSYSKPIPSYPSYYSNHVLPLSRVLLGEYKFPRSHPPAPNASPSHPPVPSESSATTPSTSSTPPNIGELHSGSSQKEKHLPTSTPNAYTHGSHPPSTPSSSTSASSNASGEYVPLGAPTVGAPPHAQHHHAQHHHHPSPSFSSTGAAKHASTVSMQGATQGPILVHGFYLLYAPIETEIWFLGVSDIARIFVGVEELNTMVLQDERVKEKCREDPWTRSVCIERSMVMDLARSWGIQSLELFCRFSTQQLLNPSASTVEFLTSLGIQPLVPGTPYYAAQHHPSQAPHVSAPGITSNAPSSTAAGPLQAAPSSTFNASAASATSSSSLSHHLHAVLPPGRSSSFHPVGRAMSQPDLHSLEHYTRKKQRLNEQSFLSNPVSSSNYYPALPNAVNAHQEVHIHGPNPIYPPSSAPSVSSTTASGSSVVAPSAALHLAPPAQAMSPPAHHLGGPPPRRGSQIAFSYPLNNAAAQDTSFAVPTDPAARRLSLSHSSAASSAATVPGIDAQRELPRFREHPLQARASLPPRAGVPARKPTAGALPAYTSKGQFMATMEYLYDILVPTTAFQSSMETVYQTFRDFDVRLRALEKKMNVTDELGYDPAVGAPASSKPQPSGSVISSPGTHPFHSAHPMSTHLFHSGSNTAAGPVPPSSSGPSPGPMASSASTNSSGLMTHFLAHGSPNAPPASSAHSSYSSNPATAHASNLGTSNPYPVYHGAPPPPSHSPPSHASSSTSSSHHSTANHPQHSRIIGSKPH